MSNVRPFRPRGANPFGQALAGQACLSQSSVCPTCCGLGQFASLTSPGVMVACICATGRSLAAVDTAAADEFAAELATLLKQSPDGVLLSAEAVAALRTWPKPPATIPADAPSPIAWGVPGWRFRLRRAWQGVLAWL